MACDYVTRRRTGEEVGDNVARAITWRCVEITTGEGRTVTSRDPETRTKRFGKSRVFLKSAFNFHSILKSNLGMLISVYRGCVPCAFAFFRNGKSFENRPNKFRKRKQNEEDETQIRA